MTVATRKSPLERARTRYQEDAHAEYEYPALPQAADPAYNFYAVYLAYPDGVILKGPHPAFVEDCTQSIVADEDNPFVKHDIEVATNAQQQAILENLRPATAKDDDGNAITLPTRRWRYVADKNQTFFEDPRVTAKKAAPFVRKISLYCPLKETGPSGALEDHGAYLAADAVVPDDHDSPLGMCERCAADPDRQHRAIKQIVELYEFANQTLPGPLSERLLRNRASRLGEPRV